jgi:hypothetical protein
MVDPRDIKCTLWSSHRQATHISLSLRTDVHKSTLPDRKSIFSNSPIPSQYTLRDRSINDSDQDKPVKKKKSLPQTQTQTQKPDPGEQAPESQPSAPPSILPEVVPARQCFPNPQNRIKGTPKNGLMDPSPPLEEVPPLQSSPRSYRHYRAFLAPRNSIKGTPPPSPSGQEPKIMR